MPAPNYSLLALDLDGTLLDSTGRVSRANAEAIARARAAGLTVTVCTGRGLVECDAALAAIEQRETVVVAGGSIVACPESRRTLHRFPLDAGLVARAVDRLLGHGFPVMVLKDPATAGYDYLIVTGDDDHPLDPVTLWWFDEMRVRVRYARSLAEDEHPEHTVRLGACGHDDRMEIIHADLAAVFGEETVMHHFPCVLGPEHEPRFTNGRRLHILEVFHRTATKWSAVQWVAGRGGVEPSRIAAIGDQINDLPMIEGAGLGIAMGNAVPCVQEAAARVTASNDDDGVARAIDEILSGRW